MTVGKVRPLSGGAANGIGLFFGRGCGPSPLVRGGQWLNVKSGNGEGPSQRFRANCDSMAVVVRPSSSCLHWLVAGFVSGAPLDAKVFSIPAPSASGGYAPKLSLAAGVLLSVCCVANAPFSANSYHEIHTVRLFDDGAISQ